MFNKLMHLGEKSGKNTQRVLSFLSFRVIDFFPLALLILAGNFVRRERERERTREGSTIIRRSNLGKERTGTRGCYKLEPSRCYVVDQRDRLPRERCSREASQHADTLKMD